MEAEFWQQRWRDSKIGFHQSEVNKLLMKHWPRLSGDMTAETEVFVPLCGKSLDMIWLSNGDDGGYSHHVIGVELSPLAIEQYFGQQGVSRSDGSGEAGAYTVSHEHGFDVCRYGRCELWCGDFFTYPKARLAGCKLAYDRASLIALPVEMRQRYAAKMHELLPSDARMLLLTIAYDQSKMDGPPFSVSDDEVHALYGHLRRVEHLETRDAMPGSANLRERGLTAATTSAFIIGEAIP